MHDIRKIIMTLIIIKYKTYCKVNHASNSQTINITAIHKKSFDK